MSSAQSVHRRARIWRRVYGTDANSALQPIQSGNVEVTAERGGLASHLDWGGEPGRRSDIAQVCERDRVRDPPVGSTSIVFDDDHAAANAQSIQQVAKHNRGIGHVVQ